MKEKKEAKKLQKDLFESHLLGCLFRLTLLSHTNNVFFFGSYDMFFFCLPLAQMVVTPSQL